MKQFSAIQRVGVVALAAALAWMTAGCETMNQITAAAADVAAGAGVITKDQAESTKRVSTAVTKTLEDITPEQYKRIIENHGADKIMFGTDHHTPYDEDIELEEAGLEPDLKHI